MTNLKVKKISANSTAAASLSATWRPLDDAVSYRITLTDKTGKTVGNKSVKQAKKLKGTLKAPKKQGLYTISVIPVSSSGSVGLPASVTVRIKRPQ